MATGTLPAGALAAEASPADAPPAEGRPSFHAESDALRFWVFLPDQPAVGASVSRSVLNYRFSGCADGAEASVVYAAHRAEIDAAVRRRVAAGAREPVILQWHDLAPPPR